MTQSRSFLLFLAALSGSLLALTNFSIHWLLGISLVLLVFSWMISRSLALILTVTSIVFSLGFLGGWDSYHQYLDDRTWLNQHQSQYKASETKPIYDGVVETAEKDSKGEWQLGVIIDQSVSSRRRKDPSPDGSAFRTGPGEAADRSRSLGSVISADPASRDLFAYGMTTQITLYLRDGAAHLTPNPGDAIRFQSKIKILERAPMPGIFDPFWFGYSKTVIGQAIIYHPYQILFIGKKSPGILSTLRSKLKINIQANLLPRQASLLIALMLGQKASFDDDQKSIYREVGAGYLLAVSGLQVSILAVFLLQVFLYAFLLIPPIGRRNRARTYATYLSLFCIWMFVGIVGFPPSAIRAAIMASSLLVGFLVRRSIQPLDALGVAGLISILLWPNAATDPGFLLSYAALFGLVIVDRESVSPYVRIFAASISAGLMTLPVCAFLFGQVVPTSLLTNALIIPVASALQLPAVLLGFIGATFSSQWILEIAAFFAGSIEAFCEMVSSFTPGIFWLQIPNAIQLIWIVLATSLFVIFLFRYRRWPIFAFSILFLVIGCKPLIQLDPRLHATFLPVGQGDATFIQFPNGKTMLVDGGGHYRESFNPGESIILPYLKHRGIKKIDIVALTHPDADHVLGLIPILNEMAVGEIWHSGFTSSHPLMERFLEAAQNKNIPVHSLNSRSGSRSIGSSQIQILAPVVGDAPHFYSDQSINDNSLVLRITHNNHSLLLTGDIEAFGEKKLVQASDIESTIVKAPHHGSKTSSTSNFVKSTHAQHVIFCTGRDNRFNFPHFQVLKRWQVSGAKIWNTAKHGMIDVWLPNNPSENVAVKGYLNG